MKYTPDKRFDIYSFLIISLFTLLLILRWRWMPTFIDIYYHLLTMQNFLKSAGIPAVSLWEYAPFGRPHLYPPLLHILMLAVYKFHISLINLARFFELISFPLVLTTILLVIRRIFNGRLAFWAVLISASMYSFYLSSVDFLAATLAFCLGLLVFYCLERKKIIGAVCFLALCLYSQISLSLFFLLALLIYGLLRREKLRSVLIINISALILYLPLLLHELRFIRYLDLGQIAENFPFELNIAVYLLALFGAVLAFKRIREYAFFVALILASLPFLSLRYRFFSGQGMIGIILLASLSLEFFYNKFYSLALKRSSPKPLLIYLLLVFLVVFLFSPSITIKKNKISFSFIGSTYINIFPAQGVRQRTNEISIYMPKSFSPVFEVILKETKPDDLIASNFEYMAGFISVFTLRQTTSAMLQEVKPFIQVDPFKYAKVIVWLKDPDDMQQEPQALIERLGLERIADTPVFFVYKNPSVEIKGRDSKAVFPIRACFIFFTGLVALGVFDLSRPGQLISCAG